MVPTIVQVGLVLIEYGRAPLPLTAEEILGRGGVGEEFDGAVRHSELALDRAAAAAGGEQRADGRVVGPSPVGEPVAGGPRRARAVRGGIGARGAGGQAAQVLVLVVLQREGAGEGADHGRAGPSLLAVLQADVVVDADPGQGGQFLAPQPGRAPQAGADLEAGCSRVTRVRWARGKRPSSVPSLPLCCSRAMRPVRQDGQDGSTGRTWGPCHTPEQRSPAQLCLPRDPSGAQAG